MVLYQIICRLSIYPLKFINSNFRLQFVKLFHVKHSGTGESDGTGGVGEELGK